MSRKRKKVTVKILEDAPKLYMREWSVASQSAKESGFLFFYDVFILYAEEKKTMGMENVEWQQQKIFYESFTHTVHVVCNQCG